MNRFPAILRWKAVALAPLLFLLLPGPARSDAGDPLRFTLSDAIERALSANRRIRNASSLVDDARLSVESAESSFDWRVFPGSSLAYGDEDDREGRLSGGIEVSFRKRLPKGGSVSVTPGAGGESDNFQSALSLALTQPLLRGFGRFSGRSAVYGAEFSLRSSLRSYYLQQVELTISTVSSFYEVVRQDEQIRLQRELVERLRGHARAAEAREKYGLTSPIDVYRARIELKQIQDRLVSTLESRRRAMDDLKLLLALPLARSVSLESTLDFTEVTLSEEEALETALQNRIEITQAVDQAAEKERLARLARNNTLPDLSLAADYSRSDQDESFSRALGLEDYSWQLRLTSSTDWARKAERNDYEKSLKALRRSRRNLEEKRQEVAKQLKGELFNLTRLAERIVLQKERIGEVTGQLQLAKVKYRHGLTGNFDLVEAETNLEQARVDYVAATVNYIVGTYRLREALGTLLEVPGEIRGGA